LFAVVAVVLPVVSEPVSQRIEIGHFFVCGSEFVAANDASEVTSVAVWFAIAQPW
jgi:hypothetical protein